jgi:Alkylmercury lyase
VTTELDRYPRDLAVGVVCERMAELTPSARTLHRTILRGFADHGRGPDAATVAAATPDGQDVNVLLRELHDHDVVRLDDDGRVRAAYPFSAVPTPHTVTIDGGPSVYAMCAIDALGVAEMLDRNVVITSVDPVSGKAIRVTVQDGHLTWQPSTVVVFVGADNAMASCSPDTADTPAAAADRCCGTMNFFGSPDTAQAWIDEHPAVSGVVLSQRQAVRLGIDIFGHLLDA